ncbi:MAG TPA: hypothetical protein PK993_03450 [Clostridia bacterium]|nr:hypothetical protein [Clostridia bacterium]
MKKRILQYLSLITIIMLLVGIIFPFAKVYAETYLYSIENIDGQIQIAQDSAVNIGKKMEGGDNVYTTDLHVSVYFYEYGYSGEYDGTGSIRQSFEMSGGYIYIDYPSDNKYIWEVKYIDESFNIHIQEVNRYNLNIETLQNKSVLDGETAEFTVNATIDNEDELTYQWYYIDENDDATPIDGQTSSILNIQPSNVNLYLNGARFYCEIYDGTLTNTVTLYINEGYTITYKSTDGTEIIKQDMQKYLPNSDIVLDFINIPSKQDHEFIGWSDTINSIIPKYKGQSDKFKMTQQNASLYAVWSLKKLRNIPNGITLLSTFDYGSKLEVSIIEENSSIIKNMKLEALEEKEILGSFEVTVVEGTYNGDIEIIFDIDEKYNNKEIFVYHHKKDGTIEVLKGIVYEGKLKINVKELSPFVLATRNILSSTSSPQTGDNLFTYLVILIVGCTGLVLSKKIFRIKK